MVMRISFIRISRLRQQTVPLQLLPASNASSFIARKSDGIHYITTIILIRQHTRVHICKRNITDLDPRTRRVTTALQLSDIFRLRRPRHVAPMDIRDLEFGSVAGAGLSTKGGALVDGEHTARVDMLDIAHVDVLRIT